MSKQSTLSYFCGIKFTFVRNPHWPQVMWGICFCQSLFFNFVCFAVALVQAAEWTQCKMPESKFSMHPYWPSESSTEWGMIAQYVFFFYRWTCEEKDITSTSPSWSGRLDNESSSYDLEELEAKEQLRKSTILSRSRSSTSSEVNVCEYCGFASEDE